MEQNILTNSTIDIAIADDHTMVRDALSIMINSFENCRIVLEAENGQDLITQLSHLINLPRVCILDISMPILDGYETIKIIKKQWPELKVIVLSMYSGEFALLQMVKNGANGFLLKNCHPNNLKDAIFDVCNEGFYYSENLSRLSFKGLTERPTLSFTKREMELLKYCSTTMGYNEIAEKMGISIRTVESIRSSLGEKLMIKNRIGLAIFAIKAGIVPIDKYLS